MGGYVRDALRGIQSHDVDIACSAPWQVTKALMEQRGFSCHETGVKFGTLTVIANNESFEITTFRTEGAYQDNRHPDHVMQASSIEEDLARRDFTINAMAFHPNRGLLDPYAGLDDLQHRVIRTVGNPHQRFNEDALRIMRALRFASKLDFSIEPNTLRQIYQNKENLSNVAVERLGKELDQMLCGPAVTRVLDEAKDVFAILIPELEPLFGLDQKNPYHCFDAYGHTIHAVGYVKPAPLNRWTALLHDIAKPETRTVDSKGVGHFKGHPERGAELALTILRRLKYPKHFTHDVCLLVQLHDTQIPATTAGVCHMLHRLGGREDLFDALYDMKLADERSKSSRAIRGIEVKKLPAIFAQVKAEQLPCSVNQLAINGKDLIDTGMEPGPQIKERLEALLQDVMDGNVSNTKEALLSHSRH